MHHNRRSSSERQPPAAAPVAGAPATTIAGRYRVEKQLGLGGMARVWQVHDCVSGRALALKRLSRQADRRHLALFEREYYTLTSLHHPNIVEVHDYASDHDGPFYTMELLGGGDVAELAPRAWPEACRMLRDLASALALLHARRYLHRDISARNVWLTPEGRIKLIDFGTLTPFGKAHDVAGTPPYIAPEALQGSDLDQRTDLYALGALAYLLLTGRHAFPARTIHALPDVWGERPREPSLRVAELKRSDLPAVPPELDALLESLLSPDIRARPAYAADVIDALCAIAGLKSEAQPLVAASYLKSPALVGRSLELQLLRDAFERAKRGRGASLVIESMPGMGRTRLLSEVALQARLASAVVLQVDPAGQQSSHGGAEAFARKLLDALPDAARTAAHAYAPTLAHLSSGMRELLGVSESELSELPKTHGEARMRVQAALCGWFLELAADHTLVLLADDFQDFDPATAAWLAALGREGKARRLLIVASVRKDSPQAAPVMSLHRHATLLSLPPLMAAEIEAMLQAIFGRVQHVARLADVVFQRVEGNPGHTLDLVEHLVQQNLVNYVEGVWVLPLSIGDAQLPASAAELSAARIERLPAAARALGRLLSVADGLISFEMCSALAETRSSETYLALEALVREGVLQGTPEGYRFAREPQRLALLGELDDARRQRAHRISGELVLHAATTPIERLQAGLHLLLGGDSERGTAIIAAAGLHYGLVDLADVGQAAPALERALELFIALARPRHELLSLYAPLALAGYYAERRYSDRYAEPTLALLQDLLGLSRARQLRSKLGRKLSLAAGMGWAAVQFRAYANNPRVPTFRQAIMLLFNSVAVSTGVATVCVDTKRAQRYAEILEPMRELGSNHVATLMHDFCVNLAATVEDRVGLARARWQRMIDRLDSPQPIRDLPDDVRVLYLAGALYASGVLECWRDNSKALLFAQRLEDFKLKLYELSANQIRMLYYAHRGDFELAEKFRERVEVHAIQRGTAWQVETWTFVAMVSVYVRTHNALSVKHCAQQLERLSKDVPSLVSPARSTFGAYLLLHGSPEEALPWLRQPDEPVRTTSWTRSQGVHAWALNVLGRHAEARALCRHALSLLTLEDLDFPGINLDVQLQLALAEAGLGDARQAADQLDALIKRHGRFDGPLTLGALHEARAQVAVTMGDVSAVDNHLARMEHWHDLTGDRSLIARGERIAAAARLRTLGAPVRGSGPVHHDQAQAALDNPRTVVHRLRHGGERTLEGSAEWIMERLAEYADIRAGHVFLWSYGEAFCIASRGELPDPGVFNDWLIERLETELDETTVHADQRAGGHDRDRFSYRKQSYRLLRLFTSGNGSELIGALLLSEQTLFRIPPKVLQVIADRLHASAAEFAPTAPS